MKFYMAAILAIVFLELFSVCIIRGTLGSQTMALDSCVDLQTDEINIRRIAAYTTQTRPVKAVILITRRGVKVCVPHDLPWVTKTMNYLDRKKAIQQRRTTSRS
ncbi:lymphotactin isoform X2 [Zootoca vivipara]|uniref:lymphotactin isoform X2 n=1 Tax=Zootoca vivipara TaxID=8524 RepID=UPI001592196A|nr:lymphotactin isoform X2 [Zootoca vivipara]